MAEHVVEFGKVGRPREPDGRLDAPAFHRNHVPIWSVLAEFLQDKAGEVLEVGSGTGQHVVYYAQQSPRITWWPSDCNNRHLTSIEAWRSHARLANVRAPARIDLSDRDWVLEAPGTGEPGGFLAIVCANVLHIAPWRVAEGLFAGAALNLRLDGRLFVYGPFMRNGRHTAPSNEAFDAKLRGDNPEWGVRDIDDLERLAALSHLRLIGTVEMPANNMILVFSA